MADFMRIRFTASAIFETEGYRKGPKFEPGEIYDCAADWGRRWIERDVAEEIAGAKDPKGERWVLVAPPAARSESAKPDPAKAAAEPAALADPATASDPA